jgi:predicted phosphodiesterase
MNSVTNAKHQKYAVISDIHSNLEALQAVVDDIREQKVDEILCLGDLVGYGPEPNGCIEMVKSMTKIIIPGNHDWAAIGLTDIYDFNTYAKEAVTWTSSVLEDDNFNFIQKLPLIKRIQTESLFLVHGSPIDPDQWRYILNYEDARLNFAYMPDRFCLIGHSHIPLIIEEAPNGKISVYENQYTFNEDCRYIINVGSVGQPRDGNSKASYAIFNHLSVEIRRIEYPVEATQQKMRQVGLPSYLVERLAFGR